MGKVRPSLQGMISTIFLAGKSILSCACCCIAANRLRAIYVWGRRALKRRRCETFTEALRRGWWAEVAAISQFSDATDPASASALRPPVLSVILLTATVGLSDCDCDCDFLLRRVPAAIVTMICQPKYSSVPSGDTGLEQSDPSPLTCPSRDGRAPGTQAVQAASVTSNAYSCQTSRPCLPVYSQLRHESEQRAFGYLLRPHCWQNPCSGYPC